MHPLKLAGLTLAAVALLAFAPMAALAGGGHGGGGHGGGGGGSWHGGSGGHWHGHSGNWHGNGGSWSGSVGFYFGAPLGWPGWYSPPYYYPYYPYYPYYYPQVIVTSPPVYIERPTQAAEAQQNWWYYCAESKTYYPYVKHCPGGWQRVTPQPPPPR